MAVLDSRTQNKKRHTISGTPRGKRVDRWADRVDQQYMARIIDEGRLTERDVAILDWLADVRCATTEHISRVFFNSQGTARNRLTQLYKMRMVERAFLPPDDAMELGISPYVLVYYLGRGGRYWLTKMESRRFESGWKVRLPQHVAHDLMSTELIAALLDDFARLDKATGTRVRTRLESEVVFWKLDAAGKPELRDVKRRGGTVKEKVPLLRSDMRLEAKFGEDENAPSLLSVFVEAERGTMTNPQFAEKVTTYNKAAAQWRNQEAARAARGDGEARPFPQILVVTTGAGRAKNLAQTISKTTAKGMMWAVIDWEGLRAITEGILTEPVWRKAAQGKMAPERALLPSLAKWLGAAAEKV